MTFTKLICVDPASMYIWGVMGCCIRGGASKASTAYHQFITCDQDKKSQFSFYLFMCIFAPMTSWATNAQIQVQAKIQLQIQTQIQTQAQTQI